MPDGFAASSAPGVGYRITVDLSPEDADEVDRIASREGLQTTEVLVRALRAYSRTGSFGDPLARLSRGLRTRGAAEPRARQASDLAGSA